MKAEEMTYEEAMQRLEELARQAEDGTLPIDQLASKLRQAQHLLQLCRTRLTAAEEEVQKLTDASKTQT